MTYRPSLFLLTLAAISAPAAPLFAHAGDRLFPIVYLSEQTLARLDLNDGSVEDWLDAVGEPTLTPLDFILWSHPSLVSYDQFDPSNLDFRIWLGWSRDGRIHVAGEFADDIYENEYDPEKFRFSSFDDSISLLVDGDHTGGQYLFSRPHNPDGTVKPLEGPLETNMQAQVYEAVSHHPDGQLVSLPETMYNVDERWMVEPPFARGGGAVLGENPTFWIVEFYATCYDRLNHLAPEESDVSQLSEGKVIGFDIYVFDHDLPNSRRHARYSLSDPELWVWGEGADNFADGLLLGSVGGLGDSAVQSVSWGRIKASLEPGLPGK